MKIGDIHSGLMLLNQDNPGQWYVFTGDSFAGFKSLDEALKLSQQLRDTQIANNKERRDK